MPFALVNRRTQKNFLRNLDQFEDDLNAMLVLQMIHNTNRSDGNRVECGFLVLIVEIN